MEEKDAIEINEADKLQKYLSDTLTQISGKQYVFRDSQEILTLYWKWWDLFASSFFPL